MSEPFEMRAGVRVFITSPLPAIVFAEDSFAFDQQSRATLVSQHSKDRWWAETDAGSRVLLSKSDVVPLDEFEKEGERMAGVALFGGLILAGALALWLFA